MKTAAIITSLLIFAMSSTRAFCEPTNYIFVVNSSAIDQNKPQSLFEKFISSKVDIGDTFSIINGHSGKTVFYSIVKSKQASTISHETHEIRKDYVLNEQEVEYSNSLKTFAQYNAAKLSLLGDITTRINEVSCRNKNRSVVSFINMSDAVSSITQRAVADKNSDHFIPVDNIMLCKASFSIVELNASLSNAHRNELHARWSIYTSRLQASAPEIINNNDFADIIKYNQPNGNSCTALIDKRPESASDQFKVLFTWEGLSGVDLRIVYAGEVVSKSRPQASFGEFYSRNNEYAVFLKQNAGKIRINIIHTSGMPPTKGTVRIMNISGTKEYSTEQCDTAYGRYITPNKGREYPYYVRDIDLSTLN